MNFVKNIALLATSILLVSSPAFADVKAGVDAWERGDYPTAVKEWRPIAIKGDPDAQFNLAQAYRFGRGVEIDMKQAEDWYRKAANQGHFQAEDNLGLIMFQNGDRQNAMPVIERSAARGDPRAQYVLGTALYNGDHMKQDWVRAYALMTRASAAGLPRASASLAQLDQYIPLDQRQKGLVMARDLELASARPQLPPVSPINATIRPKPLPTVISEALIPASGVNASKEQPRPQPAVAESNISAPKPLTKAQNAGPMWRIQLGAFGDPAKAKALWLGLSSRVSALSNFQPSYVKAGPITRLQTGPLTSRSAAEKLCFTLISKGNACLVVAP